MTRLLMCPPTNFSVTYDINPWMTRYVGVATPDAQRQWDRLVETLECAGDARIERVESQMHLPDLVFTANAALISGSLAIMSSFRHPERRREQSVYRGALGRAGFATTYLEQTFFEGAGDALFDRRRPLLYVGYGWRTQRVAAMQLGETLGVATLPLLLVDERFYHLDTCLCPLASGHVLAFMDAFSPHAQKVLRRTIEPECLIEVSLEDALAFACNAVEIGDSIVLHAATARLRTRLNAAGYRVFATELTEFLKAGGSAKCLTLKLNDGPAGVGEAAA
ncbi:MAG: arginine deiminase-related protein [Candidatus Eremiobacteraeota bacterium]|nr:arginine deiminase-related protein [Candidatus Eremiobacteraeota bacterium]